MFRKYLTFLFLCLIVIGCASIAPQAHHDKPVVVQKDLVILLHGLGKGKLAMLPLAGKLKRADYDVARVEYDSLTDTPQQIIDDVSDQISSVINNRPGKVNFVGHSLGGLIIRAYLENKPDINLGRVVMIGSPSHGTPLVDYFQDYWLMNLLGPTARKLGTDEESFPESLKPPYYPVGIIAGRVNSRVAQAIMKAESDGIVPIESTPVQGMTDFYLLESRHAALRFDDNVAYQTIQFLKHGRFDRSLDITDEVSD